MSEDPGTTIATGWLASSPMSATLGFKLDSIEPGNATVVLPFSDHVCTMGDLVHGGAIAALIDAAATVAAWAGADVPDNLRGTTVALSVNYTAGARASDIRARAQVVRRGKSLSFLDVEVVDAAESLVAKGLVTYKIG